MFYCSGFGGKKKRSKAEWVGFLVGVLNKGMQIYCGQTAQAFLLIFIYLFIFFAETSRPPSKGFMEK